VTITRRHELELDRTVRYAVRRFKTVRAAAKYLGMPKSRLFDYCQARRIQFARAR
jgi:hypothetical protein